jgi:tRNA U34 2-thiouridine synthase MnmA/TrmU
MGLVIGITRSIDLPDDEGESAVIRKLSHRKLAEAATKQQSQGIGFMRELGAELMKALKNEDSQKIDRLQKTQEASLSNYHRDTILEKGIVSWTLTPGIGDTNRTEVIGELDEPTAAFLAEAIFTFSRPETEDEAGNGQGGS